MKKIDSGKIFRLRFEKGISQENLAFLSGLTASTVAAIETGRKTNPRIATLMALAQGLGVDFISLFCDDVPSDKKKRGKR